MLTRVVTKKIMLKQIPQNVGVYFNAGVIAAKRSVTYVVDADCGRA